jgi:uncharacterized FlaG/YvyC family protein
MPSDPIAPIPALGAIRGVDFSTSLGASGPPASASAPPAAASSPPAPAEADVRRAVVDANAKLSAAKVALEFSVDLDESGSVRSIRLMDAAANQVVMQFPSEQMLAVRDNIDSMIAAQGKEGIGSLPGAIFSQSA